MSYSLKAGPSPRCILDVWSRWVEPKSSEQNDGEEGQEGGELGKAPAGAFVV